MVPWTDERREHPRVALHWPAVIRRTGEDQRIRVQTQNLSCGGAYCLSREAFRPGERVELVLLFPEGMHPQGRLVKLHCSAAVVRVEPVSLEQGYGIACRIEDYSVVVGVNGHWFDELEMAEPAEHTCMEVR